MLGAVDELDDAPGRLFAGALDTTQRAIADAGGFARPHPARRDNADDGRGAVSLFVPFGRPRQELAVAVAASDVGNHNRRQRTGAMQLFAPPLDMAFVGEFAKHALERGAVGVLGPEGAGDLACADPAALLTHKCEQFVA